MRHNGNTPFVDAHDSTHPSENTPTEPFETSIYGPNYLPSEDPYTSPFTPGGKDVFLGFANADTTTLDQFWNYSPNNATFQSTATDWKTSPLQAPAASPKNPTFRSANMKQETSLSPAPVMDRNNATFPSTAKRSSPSLSPLSSLETASRESSRARSIPVPASGAFSVNDIQPPPMNTEMPATDDQEISSVCGDCGVSHGSGLFATLRSKKNISELSEAEYLELPIMENKQRAQGLDDFNTLMNTYDHPAEFNQLVTTSTTLILSNAEIDGCDYPVILAGYDQNYWYWMGFNYRDQTGEKAKRRQTVTYQQAIPTDQNRRPRIEKKNGGGCQGITFHKGMNRFVSLEAENQVVDGRIVNGAVAKDAARDGLRHQFQGVNECFVLDFRKGRVCAFFEQGRAIWDIATVYQPIGETDIFIPCDREAWKHPMVFAYRGTLYVGQLERNDDWTHIWLKYTKGNGRKNKYQFYADPWMIERVKTGYRSGKKPATDDAIGHITYTASFSAHFIADRENPLRADKFKEAFGKSEGKDGDPILLSIEGEEVLWSTDCKMKQQSPVKEERGLSDAEKQGPPRKKSVTGQTVSEAGKDIKGSDQLMPTGDLKGGMVADSSCAPARTSGGSMTPCDEIVQADEDTKMGEDTGRRTPGEVLQPTSDSPAHAENVQRNSNDGECALATSHSSPASARPPPPISGKFPEMEMDVTGHGLNPSTTKVPIPDAANHAGADIGTQSSSENATMEIPRPTADTPTQAAPVDPTRNNDEKSLKRKASVMDARGGKDDNKTSEEAAVQVDRPRTRAERMVEAMKQIGSLNSR